jgi:hypothetical protein
MAKQVRERTADAKVRRAAARPRTRGGPADGVAVPTARRRPSEPMRLAAEVTRLDAALAAIRARVAELEEHAKRD